MALETEDKARKEDYSLAKLRAMDADWKHREDPLAELEEIRYGVRENQEQGKS